MPAAAKSARNGSSKGKKVKEPTGLQSPAVADGLAERLAGSLASDVVGGDFRNAPIIELFQRLLNLNIPEVQQITTEILCRINEISDDAVQKEVRNRSIVISGLSEINADSDASVRQVDTEEKVKEILNILDIECRPVKVFRMGKREEGKPRLVKVELPSRGHWVTTLSRARLLREKPGYNNVFIRRSMTDKERRLEQELRERAKQMNQGKSHEDRVVVYRGEIVPVSSLRRRDLSSALTSPTTMSHVTSLMGK
ncbi:hypothetical protein Y032_0005g2626 [Ancylostoma ceylanicum]|uniref:Uncharacterized protein n=1 Tax=Ancylostoma ceylanicum TaxID=53326 RepID=A0A016VUE8_9BILA|nr:hypothetical protein Y032_0005g2626 [Ancylostoma ceylanicum]